MTSQQNPENQSSSPSLNTRQDTGVRDDTGVRQDAGVRNDTREKLEAIRQRLSSGKGREFWRSLDDLAESPDFLEYLRQEFPRQASLVQAHQTGTMSRRDFLKLLGAAFVLAGLSACSPIQAEKILPYAVAPEAMVPGIPVYFASTLTHNGYARGVLVKTDEGRPIKIEGNPRHPLNQGASDVWMQAAILDLYDPDRAQGVTNGGKTSTWQEFTTALKGALARQEGIQGAGIHILTGTVTSPTLADQMNALMTHFPQAHWHAYSPVNRDAVYAGAQMAFGRPAEPQYRFDKAKTILSLDADFVLREPGALRYQRDFAGRRQVRTGSQPDIARLYVVESSHTNTGALADHRLAVKASQVETFARAVANRLGVSAGTVNETNLPGVKWLDALAADLKQAGSAALVLAGERQPAVVHALVHAMNQTLGSAGNTVVFTDPVEAGPLDQMGSLRQLVQDLDAGRVELLVILGENPIYTAPADLDLARRFAGAKMSVYLGRYADETAAMCTWVIAQTHDLEMWGDARAYDGTISIIQPSIDPIYGGHSPYELIAALQGQSDAKGYNIVRAYWQKQAGSATNFENAWQSALMEGLISGTALPAVSVSASGNIPAPAESPASQFELVFEPDPTIWDGAYSNNAWLQELPKPLTKLTWDNAALISPTTAAQLGIADDDVLTLAYQGRSLNVAAMILPGQPDYSITVSLGYGRKLGGRVLEGTGFNAYALRTSGAPWFGAGLDVRRNGGRYALATTRDHWSMEGREPVREASLADFLKDPNFTHPEADQNLPSLYPPFQYPETENDPRRSGGTNHAWGMVMDLSKCTACNACVLACQAENNIPIVGKDQVERGREMHWLRIDRYFKGAPENPQVAFEPLACVHCEKAPCELVCPVQATSHSAEGINEMTYNRCVGTRYCSNNCPYKVRRFNFYDYSGNMDEAIKALRNPDVTVRRRGVMEKCNYCIQRVDRARIQEKVSGQALQDGELMTACQQACPAGVIVFGDLNDPASKVKALKQEAQRFDLLGELDTQPRTTYLAKFRNPNPAIEAEKG
jgi:molybdopterin-containing oxidoreductase family iron-sulfur binding subunit